MHKKGSGYDVPIALGIIAASGQRDLPLLKDYIVMGELGLDGSVRPVPGALPIAELASRKGLKGCILPTKSALEAVEYEGIEIYGMEDLADALCILAGEEPREHLLVSNILMAQTKKQMALQPNAQDVETWPGPQSGDTSESGDKERNYMDFSEIIGQEGAKRGVEIAAAGNHNVILIGSPGSGKSSLAKAMAGILPKLNLEESLQTSKIYSVAGLGYCGGGLIKTRPFRSPHYSASVAALLGGGSDNIMPGEISLAHNGILFMDEFCETPKRVLEMLRAPMEDRKVTISRLRSKVEYPADFMLVAATNPCPCGYWGEGDRCTCTPARRMAYLSKLSGPIMDRIDVQLWVSRVDARKLVNKKKAESSATIAARVLKAREIQMKRFAQENAKAESPEQKIFCNSSMNNRQIEKYCPLSAECRTLLERIIERFGLSARACSRIIKLARTIADLAECPDILPEHISEAAGYRFLDKQNI